MKVNKKSIFYFAMFIFTILFQMYIALTPYVTLRVYQKLIVIIGCFIWVSLLMLELRKEAIHVQSKMKIMATYMWVVFMIYITNLIFLLFFDGDFGRNITVQNFRLSANMVEGINLKPFKMINDYLLAYQNENIYFAHVVQNILGNIVVFMPLGILLPILFKSLNSPLRFIITIAILILLVECSQVYFGVGVGDIDDFILNFIGATNAYIGYKIPWVNQRIKAWLYMEEDYGKR